MKLTNDMQQALLDLHRSADSVRGPANTGLSTGTYKALENRGLVWAKAWRMWKLSAAGCKAVERLPN